METRGRGTAVEGVQYADEDTSRKTIVRYTWENMLDIHTGVASKLHEKKTERQNNKTMNKYTLLMRFHNDHQLQFYINKFMYLDPDTIPLEEYFPATKTFVENYRKFSNP